MVHLDAALMEDARFCMTTIMTATRSDPTTKLSSPLHLTCSTSAKTSYYAKMSEDFRE
jgi:hypothetical protein